MITIYKRGGGSCKVQADNLMHIMMITIYTGEGGGKGNVMFKQKIYVIR